MIVSGLVKRSFTFILAKCKAALYLQIERRRTRCPAPGPVERAQPGGAARVRVCGPPPTIGKTNGETQNQTTHEIYLIPARGHEIGVG